MGRSGSRASPRLPPRLPRGRQRHRRDVRKPTAAPSHKQTRTRRSKPSFSRCWRTTSVFFLRKRRHFVPGTWWPVFSRRPTRGKWRLPAQCMSPCRLITSPLGFSNVGLPSAGTTPPDAGRFKRPAVAGDLSTWSLAPGDLKTLDACDLHGCGLRLSDDALKSSAQSRLDPRRPRPRTRGTGEHAKRSPGTSPIIRSTARRRCRLIAARQHDHRARPNDFPALRNRFVFLKDAYPGLLRFLAEYPSERSDRAVEQYFWSLRHGDGDAGVVCASSGDVGSAHGDCRSRTRRASDLHDTRSGRARGGDVAPRRSAVNPARTHCGDRHADPSPRRCRA